MGKEFQTTVAYIIYQHLEVGSLASGVIVCKCREHFVNDRAHCTHVAGVLEIAFTNTVEQAKIEAQLALLDEARRFWGVSAKQASPASSAPLSRRMYSGAQIAGWCKEKMIVLHRQRSAR